MDLHRPDKEPDWQRAPAQQRNAWQRLALATNGLITPGNALSATGLILVLIGIRGIYTGEVLKGVMLVAMGRVLDVLDGFMAEATSTKSRLGEAVDAVVDKIELVVALPILALVGVVLPWQAGVLALLHMINALCAVIARGRRVPLHASSIGKLAIASQWVAITLYGLGFVFGGLWYTLAHGTFLVSVLLGLIAAIGYIRSASKKPALP